MPDWPIRDVDSLVVTDLAVQPMREWISHVWGCVVAFLDRWQALVAGVLGFAAAIFVVRITLRGEARKHKT
jgi:hypothetical protein